MDIDIDPLAETPLYQQLRDRIVEAIAAGRLRPGEALASVRQVAATFGMSPATVAKGYDMLRAEGLVRAHRRNGTVVARGPGDPVADPAFATTWRVRLGTLVGEAYAQGLGADRIRTELEDVLAGFAPSAPGAPATDIRASDTRTSDKEA